LKVLVVARLPTSQFKKECTNPPKYFFFSFVVLF
jgi:hypothetical protein